MVDFREETLKNGLRIIVNEDQTTPLAAVNLLYEVGSRDEDPKRTGFAHLFEHLMFAGSSNVTDFDEPIQHAGGENNAYTTNDFTNFYETLPAQNIETAFWLESDRMLALRIGRKSLEVQRKVVVEEFKETCHDEPYGDYWHHVSALAYAEHGYRWPVIGLSEAHIQEASLSDVRSFYKKWYRPNNAILSVSGNVQADTIFQLAEKWFGDIPSVEPTESHRPKEAPLGEAKRLELTGKAPLPAIYIAFRMPGRIEAGFYGADLLSDVLAAGASSRLYRNLLKKQKLFSHIDAYVTANFDPGLFVIEGKPIPGVSLETAEKAIWEELNQLKNVLLAERELQKIKHRYESNLLFTEMSVLNKAQNLGYYAALGNVSLINDEVLIYNNLTALDLRTSAKNLFNTNNSVTILYVP